MIIEISRRLRHAEVLAQDVIDDLPGHRFAHGAGNGNYFEASLSTIFAGEIAQRFYRIVYPEHSSAGKGISLGIFADHRTDRAFGKGIRDVIVAVKILAGDREKAVARFCSSGVNAYPGQKVATLDLQLVWRNSFRTGSYCLGQR